MEWQIESSDPPMNPAATTRFSRFHLASLMLLFVNNIIHWEFNRTVFSTDPSFAGVSTMALYVSILAPVFLPLLLWYLVIWKHSKTAAWGIVAYALLWALGVAATASAGNLPVLMVTLTVTSLLLQTVAIFYLFRS